jgi:hypothetical protein
VVALSLDDDADDARLDESEAVSHDELAGRGRPSEAPDAMRDSRCRVVWSASCSSRSMGHACAVSNESGESWLWVRGVVVLLGESASSSSVMAAGGGERRLRVGGGEHDVSTTRGGAVADRSAEGGEGGSAEVKRMAVGDGGEGAAVERREGIGRGAVVGSTAGGDAERGAVVKTTVVEGGDERSTAAAAVASSVDTAGRVRVRLSEPRVGARGRGLPLPSTTPLSTTSASDCACDCAWRSCQYRRRL